MAASRSVTGQRYADRKAPRLSSSAAADRGATTKASAAAMTIDVRLWACCERLAAWTLLSRRFSAPIVLPPEPDLPKPRCEDNKEQGVGALSILTIGKVRWLHRLILGRYGKGRAHHELRKHRPRPTDIWVPTFERLRSRRQSLAVARGERAKKDQGFDKEKG